MFDLFKNYIPVVEDYKRNKQDRIYPTPYTDKWGMCYFKNSTEKNVRRFFFFMHKETAKKVEIMKRPLPKEWNRYKNIIEEINLNTHKEIRANMTNLPKLKVDGRVKIPSDYYEIRDIVQADMKERNKAAGGTYILQINLRLSLFKDKYGDADYVRGVEVCPEGEEADNADLSRNFNPVSWARIFLYEYPRYIAEKLYCKFMNFKNRKQIHAEYMKAREEKIRWHESMNLMLEGLKESKNENK